MIFSQKTQKKCKLLRRLPSNSTADFSAGCPHESVFRRSARILGFLLLVIEPLHGLLTLHKD